MMIHEKALFSSTMSLFPLSVLLLFILTSYKPRATIGFMSQLALNKRSFRSVAFYRLSFPLVFKKTVILLIFTPVICNSTKGFLLSVYFCYIKHQIETIVTTFFSQKDCLRSYGGVSK